MSTDPSRLPQARQESVWNSDWRVLGLDPVCEEDRSRITFDADDQPVSFLFADYKATLAQLRHVIDTSGISAETRKAWLKSKAQIDREVFGDLLEDQDE